MMRQALWILRKDVRHLWPHAAVFAAGAGLFGWLDGVGPQTTPMIATSLCGVLLWLYGCLLVVFVVQSERLTGDRQFWVTRPFSWQSLVLAKLLFLLLCLNLPVLLAELVALLEAGLSPRLYVSKLVWRHLAWLAGTLLPCAALAAVTASEVQVVLSVLTAYAGLYLVLLAAFKVHPIAFFPQGCVEPLLGACQNAIVGLLAVGVCVLQYSRRTTVPARWILACGLAGCFVLYAIFPWGPAFALVKWRSPALSPDVARLSRDGTRSPSFGADLSLPIHVSGIPAGMQAYSERIRITVEAPGGQAWDSGWDYRSSIRRVSQGPVEHRLLSSGTDDYDLNLHVDRAFLHMLGSVPVHLRATVAFTLLDRPAITQVYGWNRPQHTPGGAVCAVDKRSNSVVVSCLAPFGQVAESVVRLQPLPSGEASEQQDLLELQYVGRIGDKFSIWQMVSGAVGWLPPPAPYAVYVETREAVARFERVLDIDGMSLGIG